MLKMIEKQNLNKTKPQEKGDEKEPYPGCKR